MSWHYEFAAPSKVAAKAVIEAFAAKNQYFPDSVLETVQAAIDGHDLPDGYGLYVKTSGHIGGSASSETLEVKHVFIAPEPEAVAALADEAAGDGG